MAGPDEGSGGTEDLGDGIRALSVIPPKLKSIEELKRDFIRVLKPAFGNVSRAAATSGLARRTAYNHLATDRRFGEAWLDAVAIGYDLIDR